MVLTSANMPYELECLEYSWLPFVVWSLMCSSYHFAEKMNNCEMFPGFCHCHKKVFSLNLTFNIFVGS